MSKTLDHHIEYRTCMTHYWALQEIMNLRVTQGWKLVGIYPAEPTTDSDGAVRDYYMTVWQRLAPDTEKTPCPTQ